MSREYDLYLEQHKKNVIKGFYWLQDQLPEVLDRLYGINCEFQIRFGHDASKTEPNEYDAYDNYFYGNNKSYSVMDDFNKAWLKHIHRNPHHWQYWVLINDNPKEGTIILDMPYEYIIEMICDWWSFSWNSGDLFAIFKWYDEHKEHMKLSTKTRKTVEDILGKINVKLQSMGEEDIINE